MQTPQTSAAQKRPPSRGALPPVPQLKRRARKERHTARNIAIIAALVTFGALLYIFGRPGERLVPTVSYEMGNRPFTWRGKAADDLDSCHKEALDMARQINSGTGVRVSFQGCTTIRGETTLESYSGALLVK